MSAKLFDMVSALSRPMAAGSDMVLIDPKMQKIPRQHLRILVADDSATDRQIALALLRRLGEHADVVVDGNEAAMAAEEEAYDVILMDVNMPTLDGIEATKRIRENKPPQAAPRIVAMTGGRVAGKDECKAVGMEGYLAKPVRLEQLAQILAACRDARAA